MNLIKHSRCDIVTTIAPPVLTLLAHTATPSAASADLARTSTHTVINSAAVRRCQFDSQAEWPGPSPNRVVQRNGWHHCTLVTRVGIAEGATSKLRAGTYSPDSWLTRRERVVSALFPTMGARYLTDFRPTGWLYRAAYGAMAVAGGHYHA